MRQVFKAIAFTIIVSVFNPVDAFELLEYNQYCGQIQSGITHQVKFKRILHKSRSNFFKKSVRFNDADYFIENNQTDNTSAGLLFNYSSSIPDRIHPVTKYALWSKSTYY